MSKSNTMSDGEKMQAYEELMQRRRQQKQLPDDNELKFRRMNSDGTEHRGKDDG